MRVCVFLCVLSVCSALICPDGGMCEDRDTCCQTPSGGYGCCPLPNAECCSDHLHCCYEGTVCDLVHSKCLNKTVSLPWVQRLPAKPAEEVEAVMCPDQESECPDDTTCCQLPDGNWGCCPMALAVCCDDKRHCCPQGTTCDVPHSKCVSPTLGSTPMWRKFPARRRASRDKPPVPGARSVTCPGGRSLCPDSSTCCELSSGLYGCCPYPNAVCCRDHLHCCPGNTTCDLKHEKCTSPHTQTPLGRKLPMLPNNVPNDIDCPDKVSTCPEGNTCCQLGNGSYGCCPMPKAVCCSDHLHCCPASTTCDLAHSTCVSANGNTAWATKIPALTRPKVTVGAVPCNDSVACADGSTCCKTTRGVWACCPLPQAVCCTDHLHCCPHGTICNLAASTCDDPADLTTPVPWLEKVPALTQAPEPTNQKCDESTTCLGKATCCKTASGSWACCPLPRAGAEAEANANSANATSAPVPSHTHMCDPHTSCPKDNTCCYMKKAGKWGCCPLPKAVCCGDGDHCCPSGFTCDVGRTSCTKGRLEIPWYRKQQAEVRSQVTAEVRDVKCDPQTSCPFGSTCCQLPTQEWGCCPLVKAVCCTDREHCCPQGYSCDLKSGTCVKPTAVHRVPLTSVSEAQTHTHTAEGVVCDSQTRCSEQQTCCRISSNSWACCPYQRAVCCKDMNHCCPMGYTCDPKVKGCTRASMLTWWDASLSEKTRD